MQSKKFKSLLSSILMKQSDEHSIGIRFKVKKFYRRRAGHKKVNMTDYTPLKSWRY